MNKIILIGALSLMVCTLCGAGAKASPKAKAAAQQFKSYSMDNNYFSCSVPTDWTLKRDKDNDEDYKIYEIELVAPRSEGSPTAIYVSYYAKDSDDFKNYKDFIARNEKNALGETKNTRESYEPVKKIELAGRSGFELSSERMVFLHPESKSDESVQVKEKQYVFPAKEGFYVVRFTAVKTLYLDYVKVFEKVAKSFKGKF